MYQSFDPRGVANGLAMVAMRLLVVMVMVSLLLSAGAVGAVLVVMPLKMMILLRRLQPQQVDYEIPCCWCQRMARRTAEGTSRQLGGLSSSSSSWPPLFMFMVIAWIWRCCSVCVACGKCSIEYGGKVSSRLSRQNVVPLAGKFPLDFSGQKVVPSAQVHHWT